MAFTLSQTREELAAARQVQLRSEIRSVVLLECSASREVVEVPDELSVRVHHKSEWEAHAGTIRAFVEMRVSAEGTNEVQLSVHSRHLVEYALEPEFSPDESAIEAFANGNAVFNVWPYARELFSNLTNRMGVPLPPLPFLRFVPPPPKDSEVQTADSRSESKSVRRRPRKSPEQ